MNLTTQDLIFMIGTKQVEIEGLRREVERLNQANFKQAERIAELEAKPNVVGGDDPLTGADYGEPV